MKTDQELQSDVMAELVWEPSVNAAQIGVEVNEGIVTLTGHVNSFSDKWGAEAAAQRVVGVRALTVELDVKLNGLTERNDIDIAHSAQHILQWTNFSPDNDSIQIMVEKGWITLSGEVEWEHQRVSAASALRYLKGVKGLTNKINLKPKVSLSAVKGDIDAALGRQGLRDASQITVDVQESTVILGGTVHSLEEREIVRQSAWRTPGVHKIVDNITFV